MTENEQPDYDKLIEVRGADTWRPSDSFLRTLARALVEADAAIMARQRAEIEALPTIAPPEVEFPAATRHNEASRWGAANTPTALTATQP